MPITSSDSALIRLGRLLHLQEYTFTTVTPLTQARVNGRPENRLATDLAGVFGWSRPFEASAISADVANLLDEAGCLQRCEGTLRAGVRFSTLGPNIFVHSAYPTTASDAVFFGPDTIRFVNAIREHLAQRSGIVRRAADIGCGGGPGGIIVAGSAPQAEVWNLDINEAALRLARINAVLNQTPNCHALHSNLLDAVDGSFDLIVSNPPYLIDPQERAYRHGAGEWGEGLSLAILNQAPQRLAPGGTLLLYTGAAIIAGRDPIRKAATQILDPDLFRHSYREVDPDVFGEELETVAYSKADRIAAVVITVTRKEA